MACSPTTQPPPSPSLSFSFPSSHQIVETESSETSQSRDQLAPPTPGQLAVIESNSFVADKFVSSRKSKKWDVPPPGISLKPPAAASSSDSGVVDPSEYAPKVVPYCEVEGALGRGGEEGGEGVGGGGEEGIMAAEEKDNSISEVRHDLVMLY